MKETEKLSDYLEVVIKWEAKVLSIGIFLMGTNNSIFPKDESYSKVIVQVFIYLTLAD